MFRRSFTVISAVALAAVCHALPASAQERRPSYDYPDDQERYSAEELDNLVGSIALYPDALLAQLLIAATFPDQIEEAARYVRSNGTSRIDDQPWDVSVKAVAHYRSALDMMADRGDWTTALGRAYASQSRDVLVAVQRMRRMADAQGNLRSNEQQSISRDDDNYVIAPTQTRLIYVPVYDPSEIYTRPLFGAAFSNRHWSFGPGFPIGDWLSYDMNWRTRSVYYNGWNVGYYGYAGGWRGRSRPYIRITSVYNSARYRNVYINRDVIHRRVQYRNIDRYSRVHRDTWFGRRDVGYRAPDRSRYDAGRYDGSRNDGGRDDGGRDDGGRYDATPYRSWYDAGQRTVPDRGRHDARDGRRTDNRGNGNRGNDDRGNDEGRNDGRSNGAWNTGRDGGQRSDSDDRTAGNTNDGNRGRMIGDGRGGSIGRSDEGNRGRTIGDGQGGSIGRNDQDNRSRNDLPMIDPRRVEGQPSPSRSGGNDGSRGGERGGRGNEGRERPKY